jgi:hypothetical protein
MLHVSSLICGSNYWLLIGALSLTAKKACHALYCTGHYIDTFQGRGHIKMQGTFDVAFGSHPPPPAPRLKTIEYTIGQEILGWDQQ